MIHIPEPGDKIELTEEWTFMIHEVKENKRLWQDITQQRLNTNNSGESPCTVPVGTVITIGRIRLGNRRFESMTLRMRLHNINYQCNVTIRDANDIVGTWIHQEPRYHTLL